MQRPRREEFILAVRRGARSLQQPNGTATAAVLATDAIAQLLHRATFWLSPKVVESYAPDDFTAWPKDQQEQLRLAVENFRQLADQLPPDQPATIAQFTAGAQQFRDLCQLLGRMVLAEWLHAIETVEHQAEEWSASAGWHSRRVNKQLSESFIGIYEAPQLLIFAAPNLYVLDPLARFIPGGQGSFDLALQPSYHTTSLYRDDDGHWYVQLDFRQGVSQGKRAAWERDTFRQCLEQLMVFA